MEQLKLFLAILALTCIAFFPPAARGDGVLDDLDVSLVVLDDASDLSAELSEMRGPDDHVDEHDEDDSVSDDHEVERDEETVEYDKHNDDFEYDEHNDEEDYFEDEDDFEDGDDVDTDEPHADIVG